MYLVFLDRPLLLLYRAGQRQCYCPHSLPHFYSLKFKLWNILLCKGLKRSGADLLSAASCSYSLPPSQHIHSCALCQQLTLSQHLISPLSSLMPMLPWCPLVTAPWVPWTQHIQSELLFPESAVTILAHGPTLTQLPNPEIWKLAFLIQLSKVQLSGKVQMIFWKHHFFGPPWPRILWALKGPLSHWRWPFLTRLSFLVLGGFFVKVTKD